MKDLIDRVKAMQALDRVMMPGNSEAEKRFNAGIARAVQELTLLQRENEWRPVKFEKGKPVCEMPEDEQDILVTVLYAKSAKERVEKYVSQDTCYIEDYGDGDIEYTSEYSNIRGWGDDIIAWMPLPEPFEGMR